MNIKNYDIYNERMGASMEEKVFFLSHLLPEVDTIIDFGCADGALYKAIADKVYIGESRPFFYYGVDQDKEMLKRAQSSIRNAMPAKFYQSLDDIMSLTRGRPDPKNTAPDPKNTAIVFSSVIHEIAHYSGKKDEEKVDAISEIMHICGNRYGFAQIIIRDMAVSRRNYKLIADIPPVIANHPAWLNFLEHRGLLSESTPVTNDVLVEFLLKYRYVENWARERDEHYFPASMEELNIIYNTYLLDSQYELTYSDHIVHKYTAANVLYDWKIKLDTPTHYRKIFTKL